MIKWLICKLWGHKTVLKAYTGQNYPVGKYFRHEQSKFCLRCGTPNKKAD